VGCRRGDGEPVRDVARARAPHGPRQPSKSVIGNPFAKVFPEALPVFQEFCAALGLSLTPASKEQFVADAMALRTRGQHLPPEPGRARTEFMMRRLLGAEPTIDSLLALKGWLDQKYPP
jgi:hypothetical protein